ncbi:DUF2141 domain-containing protein [Thiotrichales bacterium 19S3-7]|nr:DUF2141 domain-containing protein [Thiotrichales bacterium 19S3-7]MCF6801099.1 DUF2141 domain-containing protein [Thiotrichales bacterium 19S3-11]
MLKRFSFAIAFLLAPYALTASELIIHVQGFDNDKGQALIALYNSAKGFPESDQYKAVKVAIKDAKASYTFKNLAEGQYAVAIVHDVNANQELDKNFFGIPKEEYGFSNNVKGHLGPPEFKAAAVQLSNGQKKVISITVSD